MLAFIVRPANANRHQTVIPAALAVVALLLSLGSSQVANAREAFGGGVAIVPDSHIEFFSFNVKQIGEDGARGHIKFAQRTDRGVSFVSHLRADCIHFLDEQTAIVACTVVDDTFPEYIGTTAAFTVRDNGEGELAPADEFTGISYALDFFGEGGGEWTCESVLDFLDANPGLLEVLLTPFAPGNIQVRP